MDHGGNLFRVTTTTTTPKATPGAPTVGVQPAQRRPSGLDPINPDGREFWVDDKYASRCFMCGKKFHFLRRKHHCRFCGQIFCHECLVVLPIGTHGSASVTTPTKSCRKCQLNLLSRSSHRTASEVQHSAIFNTRAPVQGLQLINTMTAEIQSGSSSSSENGDAGGDETDSVGALPAPDGDDETAAYFNRELGRDCDDRDTADSECMSESVKSSGGLMGVSDRRVQTASASTNASVAVTNRRQTAAPSEARSADSQTSVVVTSPTSLPNRHEEAPEDLLITYGLHLVPMFAKDTVGPWFDNLAKSALEHYAAPPAPAPQRRRQVFIPDPRARFSLETNYERLLISTAFNEVLIEQSRLAMLPLMEERCTAHLAARVRCLCAERGLGSHWVDYLCDIAWRVIGSTAVDRNPNILTHVDVMAVAGGEIGDLEILSGVCLFKQVTNRKMETKIDLPRILLLGGTVGAPPSSVDYDLEEYSNSYPGWLDKLYSRIRVWRPNVIVVEKTMHHFMQDLVLADKISLVCQVPRTVLERIERACSASIIDDLSKISITEVQRLNPTGSCSQFIVRQVGNESVMEFKGLIRPTFTSVVLRGPDAAELEECKQMLPQIFTTAYHLTLQTHYLIDFWAILAHRMPQMEGGGDGPSPESLTMNMGVMYPESISEELRDVQYTRDNIVVNCIMLPNESADDASSPKDVDALVPHRRHAGQLRVYSFYGDGDETISEFLAERTTETDSCRIFLHSNRKIIVTSRTEPRDIMLTDRLHNNVVALCSTHCKACEQAGRTPDSGDLILSRHTLNMSFGALLEMSVHGGDGCCGRCGHGLHSDIRRSFIVYPTEQTQVTVTIDVEYLPTFTLVGPRMAMLLPDGPSNDLYFSMEIAELHECVEEFILSRRASNPLVEEQLRSFLADITDMERLREFRSSIFRPMVDEYVRELRAARPKQAGAGQLEEEKKLWPSDLYFHREAGVEFRLDEHSSLIALALFAAARGVTGGSAPLQSPADAGLIAAAHRRAASMSIEGMQGSGGVQFSTTPGAGAGGVGGGQLSSKFESINASATFPTLLPPPLPLEEGQGQSGETPPPPPLPRADDDPGADSMPNREDSFTNLVPLSEIGADSPLSPFERTRPPLSNGGSLPPGGAADGALASATTLQPPSEGEVQQEQTMEQIFLTATNKEATMVSENYAMEDMDEAIDILMGQTQATNKKAPLVGDSISKFQHEFVSLEDGGRVFLKVESLFPNHFAALRYLYTRGNPDAIMHSLLRCQAFKPGAGKSGAGFFATVDEQFVLKAVKKEELTHFVRHFHRVYFAHMAEVYASQHRAGAGHRRDPDAQTSFLVKILGVYTITTKRQRLFNQEVKHYILMENLFYKRCKERIYDLKGSQRNRRADAHDVQLDENLVQETKKGFFFFCEEERKSWLELTLSTDTMLLCNSRIMDYSLIAGVDMRNHVISLGIIDFLRPYTLDKATESAFKSAKASVEAALAGATTVEDPTIIEPPNYKDRFLKWMGTYFCSVPGKTSLYKRYKRNVDRKRLVK